MSRVTYLFSGPTQELMLGTANTGKNREKFRKNAHEWTGRVKLARKKSVAVGVEVACMALY